MSLQFEFRLVDLVNTDKKQYKLLHNKLFSNTALSYERLDWYYKDIGGLLGAPYSTRTYGIFDRQLLIGVWSVEPKLFNLGDRKVVPVGRCFSVGIHPEYRRHGLFVKLGKFAIQEEKKLGQFDYIFGFPQVGRPVIGAHLKAGWEVTQRIEMYSMKIGNIQEYLPKSVGCKVESFVNLLNVSLIPNSFRNSWEYENLRWIKHPEHDYVCYSFQSSYVVLKVYASVLHILEIHGTKEDVKVLLRMAQGLCFRHNWCEITIWCAQNEYYRDVIEDVGFSLGAENGVSVDLISVRINSNDPLNLGDQCHFQLGVEEIY